MFAIEVIDLDEDLSAMRWTVDTPQDLALARALDALAGPEPYGWRDVLRVARAHPELAALNEGQTQKRVDAVDSRWDVTTDPEG
jgi:spore coat polysaccharide biosynthesis protein SpsF